MVPEIVTFEGVLISDPWTYSQQLQPGLHLIIHFPRAASANFLFSNTPPNPEPLPLEWHPQFPQRPMLNSEPSIVDPGSVMHPHVPHQIIKKPRRAMAPLYFEPPTLSFYSLCEVPISVTLTNSLLSKTAYCFLKPEEEGEISTGSSPTGQTSLPIATIWCPSLQRDWPLSSSGGGGLATHGLRGQSWNHTNQTPVRALPEVVFPLTTFDVFAQGSRRQIVNSVAWDAIAHPTGQLSLGKDVQTRSGISWDLGDVLNPELNTPARTIHWVNYSPATKFVPLEISLVGNNNSGLLVDKAQQNESEQYTRFTSSSETARKRSGKFWMLHPPRLLPAAFLPSHSHVRTDDILFYFSEPRDQLVDFFARIYKAFGFPEDKIVEITRSWRSVLPMIEQKSTRGLIVKFLAPRDMSKIFPLEIEPMPANFIRAFAVVWTLGLDITWNSQSLGVEAEETKIRKIVENICSHGEGPRGISLEGFKVFEWGGVLLPYGSVGEHSEDGLDEGQMECESGSDTASDRTIRERSSSFGQMNVDVSAPAQYQDTSARSDVDAVVFGDEGMYIVMRP